MKDITISEIEFIAFELAQELLKYDEPIPDYSTRYPNVLESCIVTPFMKFDKKYLYPGLIKKASVLFYLMIKNHPFQNGNKRIAATTLLTFLYLNEKWLDTSKKGLYDFTKLVASSPAELKDSIIGVIEEYIQKYLKTVKKTEQ